MHIHSSLLESVFLLLTVALVTTVSAKVACFKSTGELRNAVKEYAFDGAGGESTLAAKKYGYPIGNWCVDHISNFDYVFYQMYDFNQPLTNWNTSNAKSMKSMFEEASKFSQDLSHFDTSSVVNFKRMFAYAFVFDQDISMWDVGSAESMQSMFEGSGFDHSLCTWGNALESSVDVEGMFAGSGCRNMTDPDLLQTPPGPFCYRCRPICKSVSACTNLLWYKCQTPTSDRCKTTSSCFNNALEECCPGASVPTKSYKAQVLTKYKDQRCRWCTKDAVCAAQPQVTACLSNNCTANATCFASGVSKACCHGFKAPAAFLNLTRVIARKSCLDKSVCTPPRRPIRVCAAKVRRSCNTCDSTRLEPCLQNVIARPVNTKEGCCLPGGQEEKTKNVEKVLIVHNALYCE